jgi:uncharacterized protein (TIGR02452 family)
MSRDARAKWAKETINKRIPALLAGDPLASSGVQQTALLQNLQPNPSSQATTAVIHIWNMDTLTAAKALSSREGRSSNRVAILNMASCLRPGGGVMTGATSQEEFLCTRTTLYPALRESFYRLPEVSAIYTPNVLVFRNKEGEDLPKSERYHVDVASAAMLRGPDISEKRGVRTWANEGDMETVLAKMRVVMRSLVQHEVKRVVLGAWGCGAYGNPVDEVARLWHIVLLGGKKGRKEEWPGIEEVVFAITDITQTAVFRARFEDGR